MKRPLALIALGASLILTGAGCGGSTRAAVHGSRWVSGPVCPPAHVHRSTPAAVVHGIFFSVYAPGSIYRWRPGSPATPVASGALRNLSFDFSDIGWSPDGSSIAVAASDESEGINSDYNGIYVVRLDGTKARRLSDGGYAPVADDWPSWSPDGRQILFTRQRDTTLYAMIVDVTTGHTCELDRPTFGAWGKPGIAYLNMGAGSGIGLVHPATGRSRVVWHGSILGSSEVGALHWSPSGVLAAAMGKSIVFLTDAGRVLAKRPPGGWLAWSPHNVLAAFWRERIVFYSASGRRLGELRTPAGANWRCSIVWSPNGNQVLLTGKTNSVWIGTVSTKHWRQLSVPLDLNRYRDEPGCALSWR